MEVAVGWMLADGLVCFCNSRTGSAALVKGIVDA